MAEGLLDIRIDTFRIGAEEASSMLQDLLQDAEIAMGILGYDINGVLPLARRSGSGRRI